MPVNRLNVKRLKTGIELFEITEADIAGPMLIRVGQLHRKQQRRIFATEGAAGATGRWRALSPHYAQYKRQSLLGRSGKILELSGEMRSRFIRSSHPRYIQRYRKPLMQFGASSPVASYHFHAKANPSSGLPKRDPVSKSGEQLAALRRAVIVWFQKERFPVAIRAITGRAK